MRSFLAVDRRETGINPCTWHDHHTSSLGNYAATGGRCHPTPGVPKMANMLEGGGSTPICTPAELEEMGFKVVAYPLSLLACTVRAMEDTLGQIRDDGYPDEAVLPTFEELREVVGFPQYYEEEARYDTTSQ